MNNHNPKIIKHKIGLLNLAKELGNVSKTCKMMGVSSDTFYRYKQANDEGDVDALFEKNRRKPNLKNCIDIETEKTLKAYAIEFPTHGQFRASNELRKQGVFISPSGVKQKPGQALPKKYHTVTSDNGHSLICLSIPKSWF